MATESEFQDQFFAKAEAIVARVMKDGTIAAVSREAVKDVRNTFHEVFFGRSESGGEIGAPLNPLSFDLAAAKSTDAERTMTASEIARDDQPYQPDKTQSHDQAMQRGR